MTYTEAVDYIHSLLKFGSNPGLERVSAVLEALGNPQADLNFIHIAGTNGKGTTSTMLSEILKSAGYKTGLFTSPYVFDFCERIQINNIDISHDDLAQITQEVKSAVEAVTLDGIYPTEFETITAAALLYFARQKCDYVVLEVGLGGRLDSTNVIDCPQVAVLTSVSMDHMAVLGDTIEKIAAEKCGIIKQGGKVVTTSLQNETALEVIKKTANEKNAQLTVASADKINIINESVNGTDFCYDGVEYHINLMGRHQLENTIGVIEAAKLIDGVSAQNIRDGINNTVMHGRMELISENILIDGGHNEECSQALETVLERFVSKDIIAVIGMMADKECEKYLSNILPLCKSVVFTVPDNPRSAGTDELKKIARKYNDNITLVDNPKDAFNFAVSQSDGRMVLVCGSFYLLSDIFR